jgi:outer membrane lipoprotein-sorting protein
VAAAQGLQAALAKMDAASKTFKSAQADFQWDNYERVVHDTTTDKGQIFFEREGATTDVGAVLNGPDGKPKQVIAYAGDVLESYTPGTSQMQVFHAGANSSDYQGFLTLGMGGSGSDLQQKWTVTDGGAETLTIAGTKIATEKLNLVPKDPGMAKSFKNVVMWVDTSRGIGVKQIFYTASGDYRTTTYSNIRLNGHIDKGKYGIGGDNKVKTAKGTQVFNH